MPTDPECDSGGNFDGEISVCSASNHLTDGVMGVSSPVNFTQFSAWNRTATPMPRIYFRFPRSETLNSFFIRQIDLYFYKNAALRVGLPDVRLHTTAATAILGQTYYAVSFTIISNHSTVDIDNQTVKVSLVDTQPKLLGLFE